MRQCAICWPWTQFSTEALAETRPDISSINMLDIMHVTMLSQVVEVISMCHPATVSEVAAESGVRVDEVYPMLNRLVEAGRLSMHDHGGEWCWEPTEAHAVHGT